MKRFALLGDKIGYSKSPKVHQAIMSVLGVRGDYEIIDVEDKQLPWVVDRLRSYDGFNVTKPYKERIDAFLISKSADAVKIGAVNTVNVEERKLAGFNTDFYGLERALRSHNIMPKKGCTVAILGSGGSAKSACYVFREGYHIKIFNRTPSRAVQLAAAFPNSNVEVVYNPAALRADLLINCTVLGINDEMSLPAGADVRNFSAVYDLIYSPVVTPLLYYARNAGLPAYNGYSMLVHQAIKAQCIWNGMTITREQENEILSLLVE